MPKPGPKTIDDYLAPLSDEKRALLERIRGIVHAVAPKAEETISYQMPAFKLDGKGLIWFGTGAKHVALYGVSESYPGEFGDHDHSGKGTIRFPLDKPLPVGLVRKLVKARLAKIRGRKD